MPLVISDSSTLIHLAAIGRLHLLKDFYHAITIPHSVWQEVVAEGQDRPGAIEVKTAHETGWIEIDRVADERPLRLLRRDLHPGENVLDMQLPVADVADVLQGKIWAAQDPDCRPSKRQKDLADIARLLEEYPRLKTQVPDEILSRLVGA